MTSNDKHKNIHKANSSASTNTPTNTPTLSSYDPVVVHVERKHATDADVDEYINELLNRHGHWEHVQRPVQLNDYILVDMQTKINGSQDSELSGEHMSIDLSPDKMPAGFIEGVKGMLPGETKSFTFDALRANDAQNNNAGASDTQNDGKNNANTPKTNTPSPAYDTFDITLTLRDICIRVTPELTDRFVCEALTDSGTTVAELRENTRKIVQDHIDVENSRKQEAAADAELSRRLTTSIPDEYIKNTAGELYQTLVQSLEAQNATLEQYKESQGLSERQFQMQLLSQARDSLRQGLALDALFAHLEKTGEFGDANNNQNAPATPDGNPASASSDKNTSSTTTDPALTDDDINRALSEMAPGREEEARKYLKENNSWDSVVQMAGRLKAHDWLIKTATFL